MYCKNCGKKLPDNARFCDRCNLSVRQREAKMDIIEELKEERLARRKAQAIEQRLKKIQKIKRKRYKIAAAVALGVLAVWGVIVGGSFLYNSRDEALKGAKPELAEKTEAPTEAPKVTDIPEESDGFISAKAANIDFVYPDIFEETEVSEACIASFADADGKVTLVIDKELTDSDAHSLMKKYESGIPNARVAEGEASSDDGGYTITLTAGSVKHHKKSIVSGGAEHSYEITYPADDAEKYEEYIKRMDESFKVS